MLDAGVCSGGCQGKIKSFSLGIQKGESGDEGPLSSSSAGWVSPTLYNCVKRALAMALSLLTGVPTAWKPDTPCPLALSVSLPHFWVSLSCITPSPEPSSNLAYCYFDPVPSSYIAFSFHEMCLTSSFVRLGPVVLICSHQCHLWFGFNPLV